MALGARLADLAPAAMTDVKHDPYSSLREPDVRRLLTANVLSMMGMEMQAVAVGWELYVRTGQPGALGLVGLAQVVPVFLLALPAGHLADQHSRKMLMMIGQCLITLAAIGLTLLSHWRGSIGLIYLCLVVTGIGYAISRPARWSLMPQVVSPARLANAITWGTSGMQLSNVSGPALGGLVIAISQGATSAYALNFFIGLLVLVLLAPIVVRYAPPKIREPFSLNNVFVGLKFVTSTKLILAALTLDMFAVLLGGATALLPVYALDILKVGPTGLGWLRAAPSLGALSMAMILAHRPPLKHAGPLLLWAVGGFGLATIVFGLSTSFPLSLVMLAVTGALDNISVVVRSTLVQMLTPDAMRGRVSAVNSIFIGSSNELGAFESGVTAQLFGPVASVVGGGVGTILVVLVSRLLWPELRRLTRLDQIRPAEASEPVTEPISAHS